MNPQDAPGSNPYAIRLLWVSALIQSLNRPARCRKCGVPVRLCQCGEWPTSEIGRRQYLQQEGVQP